MERTWTNIIRLANNDRAVLQDVIDRQNEENGRLLLEVARLNMEVAAGHLREARLKRQNARARKHNRKLMEALTWDAEAEERRLRLEEENGTACDPVRLHESSRRDDHPNGPPAADLVR